MIIGVFVVVIKYMHQLDICHLIQKIGMSSSRSST
jgi:hypothetical protein